MFDKIRDVCNNADIERLKFTKWCQGQMEKILIAQEMADLKLEQNVSSINNHMK